MPKALLSVSDKTGLSELAHVLVGLGYELVSTGGTFKHLKAVGLDVMPVSELTGQREILGGRVKTLHPHIHGGLLAKRNAEQLAELKEHGIECIDLVVVNLYPFQQTVAKADVTVDQALETIDIGGPTMLRAAAKNYQAVTVVVDPDDYDHVAERLKEGMSLADRRGLARKAFAHTAAYDAAIVNWFDKEEPLPPSLVQSLEHVQALRYGENPHQQAARYREHGKESCWDRAVQHKGAELSYLNLFDAEAAWQLVHEFDVPACVIVKHANPCGVALSSTSLKAYTEAFACDPKSAFGGVVALNKAVDKETADAIMANAKADVVLAPVFTVEALARLHSKRKAMRVLELGPPQGHVTDYRRVDGGFLVQTADTIKKGREDWQVVTELAPTKAQWQDLEFAWLVCMYTKSNAIVLVKDEQAVGIGAGQQSRVDAANIAAKKAAGRATGGACASDAFYPFRDGLDAAVHAGVSAVIQPGGSVNDDEVVAAANEQGIAMVFTGERHFRH